jgi:hypothetical protein
MHNIHRGILSVNGFVIHNSSKFDGAQWQATFLRRYALAPDPRKTPWSNRDGDRALAVDGRSVPLGTPCAKGGVRRNPFCYTEPFMPGGRPTDDPKTELRAVRLAPRQVRWLERRARRDGITFSEALRVVLEEAALKETSAGGRVRGKSRTPPKR